MKNLLPVFALVIVAFGCAKKMAPASSASPAAASTRVAPAEPTTVKVAEPVVITPAPPSIIAKEPSVEELTIKAGQATFNAKCGTCHGLKPTAEFTAESWVGILASMAPKARLSDIEKANVYAYVKANAKK